MPKPEDVGQIIAGKYRIDRAIGAGGMGTVVAATHLQLGTPVALKFLNEKIRGSANSVERFTREARACAQLRSEHVCRVSDFGVEGDTPYIAMDLLAGIDLARLLDTGRIDVAIAVDFVIQACTGLAEAHALGIVHRDLKPGNLFLTRRPDGMPLIKVLDFGVAKIPVDDDDLSLTKTAHIVGSPGYMAPEQLRSSKTVDQRADIWALGVILYELISTRHPFYAAAMTEVALKIAMDEPSPLAEASDELRAIVMRCLSKEPEYRFRDVTELATALAPFALHDRIAAAAAMRALVETAERERVDPQSPTKTSGVGTAVTKQEKPPRVETPRAIRPESTNQHGAGAIVGRPPARRRGTWITGGVLVAGLVGAVGFGLVRSSQDFDRGAVEPPDAPLAITGLPDATVADDATSRELRVLLEIKVTGASAATIAVDGIVWGEGSRIAVPVLAGKHKIEVRASGRAPVIVEHEIMADKTIVIAVPPRPRDGGPIASAGRAIPVRPSAPLTPEETLKGNPFASTKPSGSGSGSARAPAAGSASPKPEPAVEVVKNADQAMAEAKLLTFRGTLARLDLLPDDLGTEGGKLNNELSRAQRKKDWLEVQRVAVRMNELANATTIDRAFISTKQARLTSHVRRARVADDVRAQLDQLMGEVAKIGNPVEANRKLSAAFTLLRAAPRLPAPARDVAPQPTRQPDDLLAPKRK